MHIYEVCYEDRNHITVWTIILQAEMMDEFRNMLNRRGVVILSYRRSTGLLEFFKELENM